MIVKDDLMIMDGFVDEVSCKDIRNYMRTKVQYNPHTPGIYPSDQGFSDGLSASKFWTTGILETDGEESTKVDNLLKNIIESCRLITQEFFDEDIDLFYFCYHVMMPGAKQGLHSDSTDLDGGPTGENGEQEPQEYSALIYLSDCGKDHMGGDIQFPKQELNFSPKTGDMIVFRGNHEYPHQVTEVTKGIRDTLVLFFCKKENNRNSTITSIIPNNE